MSEEANIADDIRADVGVELLCDAFVLHQEVLAEGGAGELHMELAFTDIDLLRVAAYCASHHFWPSLGDAVFQQRCLQAFCPQVSQKGILQSHSVCPYHAFTSPFST